MQQRPDICHTRNVFKTNHRAGINCVALTSKGDFVTGSEDNTVKVWDHKKLFASSSRKKPPSHALLQTLVGNLFFNHLP